MKHAHFDDPPEIRARFLQISKEEALSTITFSSSPLRVHVGPDAPPEALISVNGITVAFLSQEEILGVLGSAVGPEVTLQLLPLSSHMHLTLSELPIADPHPATLSDADEWGFVPNDSLSVVCPLCLLQRPSTRPPASVEDVDSQSEEADDGPPQMCTQHQYRTLPSDEQCAIERRESWLTFMQQINSSLGTHVFSLPGEPLSSIGLYQAPSVQIPISDEFLVLLTFVFSLSVAAYEWCTA